MPAVLFINREAPKPTGVEWDDTEAGKFYEDDQGDIILVVKQGLGKENVAVVLSRASDPAASPFTFDRSLYAGCAKFIPRPDICLTYTGGE